MVASDKTKASLRSSRVSADVLMGLTKFTYLSTNLTLADPLRNQESRRLARIALGRTYKAISPLLLPFSIQMLEPQVKHPAKTQP